MSFDDLIIAPLVVLIILALLHKLHRPQNLLHTLMLRFLTATAALGLAVAADTFVNPANWLSHWLSLVGVQYALLFYYLAIRQLLGIRDYVNLISQPIFWICNGVAIIHLLGALTLNSTSNFSLFIGDSSYRPDPLYYFQQLLNQSCLLLLVILIVRTYWQSLNSHRELTYLIRRWLGLVGFSIAGLCVMIALANLSLSILIGDTYRLALDQLYRTLRPFSFSLAALGLALPQKVLGKMTGGRLNRYWQRRQQREEALVGYLHQRMVRLVPGIYLDCDPRLQQLRRAIEISDARQLLLSHLPGPLTPRAEAVQIAAWLQQDLIFSEAGPYPVAGFSGQSAALLKKHNLTVARHLQNLEGPLLETAQPLPSQTF